VEADSENMAPKQRRKPTPEQQARDALRKRLRRVQARILSLQKLLAEIHADRTGVYHYLSRPGAGQHKELREMLARIESDAAAGCVESVNFLLANAERIGWIEYHIAKRPPARDPAYKPPPIVWPRIPPSPLHPRRSDFDHWHPHLDRNTDGD
jgi:hypothetical protein